ncbi:MAG: pyruvate, phosphate dikinase, partial [Candidatus Sumerlaeota bacterium]|nr:pyruvate, phosphate dikinase [Candidatus Sumerlaeota bacterium]
PAIYKQLFDIQKRLEKHYRDMQDIEFTIERGKLWMLQTRVGKRTGTAAVRMAVDMAEEGLITKKEAILRVEPAQLEELLHPMLDPAEEKKAVKLAKGLPAGPGGGVGKCAFTADEAEERAKKGEKVVLVRPETTPEDVHGMHAAAAILTSKGGMTSHAALVARGWGKCCIVGCGALDIDTANKVMRVDGNSFGPNDWISLNGTKGVVYAGKVATLGVDPEANEWYRRLMAWADETRQIQVRTNADTPADAEQAVRFGAQGIGLCRTEHMFFAPERIKAMREMIVAENEADRRKAVMKLLPFQKADFLGILKAMAGKPVTIRLLDPPLHEFLPTEPDLVAELAGELGVSVQALQARIKQLHELNPMLGHRGCRLGVTYPEITEMQARAIFEAAADLTQQGVAVMPEVMVPLVGTLKELDNQVALINSVAEAVKKERGLKNLPYMVGTMIEVPRAALTAGAIAQTAQFFSFGTNDLTQMTFGFSRDDIGGFLPYYIAAKILPEDPFQSVDQTGVGRLMELAVQEGRATRPDLKIGICGEHGGDPDSVVFCHKIGLNYVSCSPFRVPIARFAAAHAALQFPRGAKKAAVKPAAKKVIKKSAAKKAVKKAAAKPAAKKA